MSTPELTTPKVPSFALIVRRAGAVLIDLATFVVAAAAASTGGFTLVRPRGWDGLLYAFWFTLLGLGLAVVLQAFSHWKKGGTLGQRIVRITVIRNGMLADPVIRLVHWLLALAGPPGISLLAALATESAVVGWACLAAAIAVNFVLLNIAGRAFNDFLLGVQVERSQPTLLMHT